MSEYTQGFVNGSWFAVLLILVGAVVCSGGAIVIFWALRKWGTR